MKKRSVCILFGGTGLEHEVSLRSAEAVLNHIDHSKYNVFPVGITRDGDWVLYGGKDYSLLTAGDWRSHPDNRRAAISPVRGQGLLSFEGDCVVREWIDVVFPLIRGENGGDGTIQGLLQLAGIPYVGSHVAASAAAMDKILTKLVADHAGVPQAPWQLVRRIELENHMENTLDMLENRFRYPLVVKSAGYVSKASDRESLCSALHNAADQDEKILVEEFIRGREVQVAVMGNSNPAASGCGEVASCDCDRKDACTHIPARIPADVEETIREAAVKLYSAMGCQGMSCVDFVVTCDDDRVLFNEFHALPDLSSASMYPRLFADSGIPYTQLIDELLKLAMEAFA